MNKRILVAEDEKSIRDLLSKAIPQFLGKDTVCDIVEDGVQLVEKSQENIYNLILTDNNMLSKDGIDAIADIKNGEINKNTPIILMTGRYGEYKTKALQAGAVEVLGKPFELKDLADVIKKYIN